MSISDPTASVTFHPSAPAVIRFGPFRFDRANRILSRDGAELSLPPRVLAVLDFLVERRGKVVPKQALIDAVWNGAFVSETSLTEAISLLRQALDEDSQQPQYIQTLHRRGYRFIAPVTFEDTGIRAVTTAPQALRRRPWAMAATAAVAAVVLVAVAFLAGRWLGRHGVDEERPAVQLSVLIPSGIELLGYAPSVAISPDGRDLVFVGNRDGEKHLFHRSLQSDQVRAIEGTKGAISPFFSTDGRSVGFLADEKLKKVSLAGGSPTILLAAPKGTAGAWAEDGSIILSAGIPAGLVRVSQSGDSTVLTRPDASRGEVAHFWPQLLPGGNHVLFTSWSNTFDSASIDVVSLQDGRRRTLVRNASFPMYSATGHLIYSQPGTLVAAPFDARRAEIAGPSVTIAKDVLTFPFTGLAQAAISRSGELAYVPGKVELVARELAWRQPDGTETVIPAPPRLYRNAKVSPDGTRAAVTILDEGRSDVWVVRLSDGSITRLTFDGFNIEPIWSPDGNWVVFASDRGGPYNIYRRAATGEGELERLVESKRHQYPFSWARDGTMLIVESTPDNGFDLWTIHPAGSRWEARPFSATAHQEFGGRFSPDGKWIAYSSNESGAWEIYVRQMGRPGKWQVSLDGGYEPFWSADGRTIYYAAENRFIAVPVELTSTVQLGKHRSLLESREDLALVTAGPSDRLLLIRERKKRPRPQQIEVVLGWPALLD